MREAKYFNERLIKRRSFQSVFSQKENKLHAGVFVQHKATWRKRGGSGRGEGEGGQELFALVRSTDAG